MLLRMNRIFAVLLICTVVYLFSCQTLAQDQRQRETVARIEDVRGDDVGGGSLLYPDHAVYVPGLFDLLLFEVSKDDEFVYFDFQFAALTNPFRAPEGYFHQRLEVYIQTGQGVGRTEIQLGSHKLQTAPDLGWNLRLSIAPFDETRLYVVDNDDAIKIFSDEVTSHSLPEKATIRVAVNCSVLPQPDSTWGYYILVGSFDGLAEGFWRDVGEGPWQLGGEGLPVFDLLAPRLNWPGQQRQLKSGVLYPVYGGKTQVVLWLLAAVLVIGAFCLWRWRHGRA